MKSHREQQCERAEPYYLSLALGTAGAEIPAEICDHIRHCGDCRSQVDEMKRCLLAGDTPAKPAQAQLTSYQTEVLSLHMHYLGLPVNCALARPLLPSLLETDVNLLTSTPITKHLEHCKACQYDLCQIEEMNLAARQHQMLRELWADTLPTEQMDCATAADSIASFVRLDVQAVEPEVIRHLCRCEVCQLLIDQARTHMIDHAKVQAKHNAACATLTPRDCFDFCFPMGTDVTEDVDQPLNQATAVHIRQCPQCLADLQQLNRKIIGIRQRPESGVVTSYRLDKSTGQEQDHLLFKGGQDELVPRQAGRSKQRPGLKPLIKISLAAAVILAFISFFSHTPTVSAVSVESINEAIRSALNIHVKKFKPGRSEAIEEMWISRSLGLHLLKNSGGMVIKDTKTGTLRRRRPGTEHFETSEMTPAQSAEFRKKMNGSLGVVPFPTDVPSNARLTRLNDGAGGMPSPLEMYELAWERELRSGETVKTSWRISLEPGTHLPVKTETHQTQPGSPEYEPRNTFEVERVTEEDIQDVLLSWQP